MIIDLLMSLSAGSLPGGRVIKNDDRGSSAGSTYKLRFDKGGNVAVGVVHDVVVVVDPPAVDGLSRRLGRPLFLCWTS